MPAWRAASMMSVPLGASTGLPSIVSFTRSGILDHHRFRNNIFVEIAGEFFDDGDRGHRRRVAERAEGPAEHVLRKLAQQRDVFAAAVSLAHPREDLTQPGRTLAARNAPPAAFVRVK